MTFEEQCALLTDSGFLDADWYLETYPDVAAVGMEPAVHYMTYGAMMGRNPGPGFDTRFYARYNPDIASSGLNPLVHFLLFGQQENRQPQP